MHDFAGQGLGLTSDHNVGTACAQMAVHMQEECTKAGRDDLIQIWRSHVGEGHQRDHKGDEE